MISWPNWPYTHFPLNYSHNFHSYDNKWLVLRETVNFVFQESQCFLRWKFGSWKFIKPHCNAIVGQHSQGNNALLTSDITDFAIIARSEILVGTVSLLDIMWLWNNQWKRVLLGKNFRLKKRWNYDPLCLALAASA